MSTAAPNAKEIDKSFSWSGGQPWGEGLTDLKRAMSVRLDTFRGLTTVSELSGMKATVNQSIVGVADYRRQTNHIGLGKFRPNLSHR
jgi:hypothetical protein